VLVKQDTSATNVDAIAANDAGDIAIARENGSTADAFLHLFKRTSTYGLGASHALTGFSAPRGTAYVGSTAFTSVVTATKQSVVRTRSLDKTGAGTDDAFVNVDSNTDRFDGVVVGLDGSLYVTAGARAAGTFTSKIWKFDQPLNFTKTYTALPATPVATSSSIRLTSLCRGPRATELYATGYTQTGTGATLKTLPVVARVTLATGTITTLFTGTVDAQQIGACAVTNAGIAVGLYKGTGAGTVTTIDPATGALATTALFTGYTASAALDRTVGLTTAQGYLFATSSEAASSSLIRFARSGGF
jgi:hypothetical protein